MCPQSGGRLNLSAVVHGSHFLGWILWYQNRVSLYPALGIVSCIRNILLLVSTTKRRKSNDNLNSHDPSPHQKVVPRLGFGGLGFRV